MKFKWKLMDKDARQTGIGVYLGDKKLKKDNITIYPLADFLSDLHSSKIL